MGSRRILNGMADATVRVREGQTLAKSLEEQKMFPDLSVEMIEVGESTGALAGDAQFGGGILRRGCADRAGHSHGAD